MLPIALLPLWVPFQCSSASHLPYFQLFFSHTKTLIICHPHFPPHPGTLNLWLVLPCIHPQLPCPFLLPLCFPSKTTLGWSLLHFLQPVNVDTQNHTGSLKIKWPNTLTEHLVLLDKSSYVSILHCSIPIFLLFNPAHLLPFPCIIVWQATCFQWDNSSSPKSCKIQALFMFNSFKNLKECLRGDG